MPSNLELDSPTNRFIQWPSLRVDSRILYSQVDLDYESFVFCCRVPRKPHCEDDVVAMDLSNLGLVFRLPTLPTLL